MKALLFKNNELMLLGNYPLPVPGRGEALVRVVCAGICATDIEITKGYMGYNGILGHEFAGVVEECTDKSLVGKRVTGEINIACGKCAFCKSGLERHCPQRSVLGIMGKDGAFAEYLTLPVKNLHRIPHSLTDEAAVFVEPVAAAFEILEQVTITTDKRVCVMGDGRLGLLAAQVLAATGCRLTVEGRHEEKLALLKARGINTRISKALHSEEGEAFDVIVECTGSTSGLKRAMERVKPKGTIVLKTTVAGERRFDLNPFVINEITLIGSRCGPFKPAIKALKENTIDVEPLISKVFPLHEGIEAIHYAAQKGVMKVLLKMQDRISDVYKK